MTTKVRSCEATRSIRCDLQMERENWPSLRAGKVLKFSLKNLGALKRGEGTRARPPVISRERTNRITAWQMDGFKLWVQVEATDSNSFVIDHNALSNGKTGLSLPSSLILHLYIPDIYSNLERGCPRKGGQIFPNFSWRIFKKEKGGESTPSVARSAALRFKPIDFEDFSAKVFARMNIHRRGPKNQLSNKREPRFNENS